MEVRKYWLERDGIYLGPFDTATEAAHRLVRAGTE